MYSRHTFSLSTLPWPFLSLQGTVVGCSPLQHTYWSGGRRARVSCCTAAALAVHTCWGWWCLVSGMHCSAACTHCGCGQRLAHIEACPGCLVCTPWIAFTAHVIYSWFQGAAKLAAQLAHTGAFWSVCLAFMRQLFKLNGAALLHGGGLLPGCIMCVSTGQGLGLGFWVLRRQGVSISALAKAAS